MSLKSFLDQLKISYLRIELDSIYFEVQGGTEIILLNFIVSHDFIKSHESLLNWNSVKNSDILSVSWCFPVLVPFVKKVRLAN